MKHGGADYNRQVLTPSPGEHISEAVRRAVALAVTTGAPVSMVFNNIPLTVTPMDYTETVLERFWSESDRRYKEHVASSRYKQQQAEIQGRDKKRRAVLAKLLSRAPAKMTLLTGGDAANIWGSQKSINSDPYGKCVITYAERWARCMEAELATGCDLGGCAEHTSRIADVEGITGFMYGCAVSILSRVWIHGEQLRQWHNLETQLKDEGERANKSGTVLNPAILKVGG